MRTDARAPSHLAVSTTVPGRSAATPSPVTTATGTSLELQPMARPGSGSFEPSSALAVSAKLPPTTTEVGGSPMSTAATRAGSTGTTMLARASSRQR